MRNDNSNNLIHRNILDQNCLTYERALSNMLAARWQHKGGVAMDQPQYKVYHWINKEKNLKRYLAYIKLPAHDKPIKKYFSTDEGEAKAWRFVFDIIDRYKSGEAVQSLVTPDITFNEFIVLYEAIYFSKLRQNKKNLQQQKNRLNLVAGYFGKMQLKNICIADIEQFRLIRKRTVSNNTINKEVAILSAMLTAATDQKYVPANVCHKVKKLEVIQSIHRLPISNLSAVFKAVWDDKQLRDYCSLLYYTGLRCEDVISLKVDNIKEKSGIKYFEVIEGKTNKTVIIPIHQSLYDNKIIVEDSEYVFQYDRSRFSAVGEIGRTFKKVLMKNNLNTATTPYWFRHTFQDSLESVGVEEGTIRHLMGKSLTGSLNYYSHSNLERLKVAIDKLPNYTFFALLSHQPNLCVAEG